jgi:hypothetical protein
MPPIHLDPALAKLMRLLAEVAVVDFLAEREQAATKDEVAQTSEVERVRTSSAEDES